MAQPYARTVKAAVAETKSKFALAEALAEDIPPRRAGRRADDDGENVTAFLAEARRAIIEAGGEDRSVETLRSYRQTALWNAGGTPRIYRWIPGASFTAHDEARKVGMTYAEFKRMPVKTTDEIRRKAGRRGTDGPPSKIAEGWTPQQKAQVVTEALNDPEVVDQVVQSEPAMRNISEGYARTETSKEDQRKIKARQAAQDEDQPGAFRVQDMVPYFLGSASELRRFAEEFTVRGGADTDAYAFVGHLAQHLAGTAEVLREAAQGHTGRLTDADFDALLGRTS